ncbi:hypothetical protein key_085 [Erwinia phage KEY]|uniref:Uncharacterized protein n=1 Tax=Erwinia phage KEY TaxID=2821255 RepID=A0AAE7WB03_9CAUD|nr:hypothetical protein key_085 [Erwinia phage KEY]
MENHIANYFIYCTDVMLKRRVSKVYHFRDTKEPFVYDVFNTPYPLSSLTKDYMVLKYFNEINSAHSSNRQNTKGWLHKLNKRNRKLRELSTTISRKF